MLNRDCSWSDTERAVTAPEDKGFATCRSYRGICFDPPLRGVFGVGHGLGAYHLKGFFRRLSLAEPPYGRKACLSMKLLPGKRPTDSFFRGSYDANTGAYFTIPQYIYIRGARVKPTQVGYVVDYDNPRKVSRRTCCNDALRVKYLSNKYRINNRVSW